MSERVETTWPEPAMTATEDRIARHVRAAMRAYGIQVLAELQGDVHELHDPELREALIALLEAKKVQLRRYNHIDYREQPEPRSPE